MTMTTPIEDGTPALYIGTKKISATPMTRAAYNAYRGWALPDDENGDDEGYLVEYHDGGKANHPDHKGYISWSPADVFAKAYTPIFEGLTFSHAVELLKDGAMVARKGWNGKGMWLVLVGADFWGVGVAADIPLTLAPWIGMKTADASFVPWLASQTDVLAEDWGVVGFSKLVAAPAEDEQPN
jgi:hypothetical protein